MSDIGFWLSKKYAIQGQQADTAGRLQNSQAAHTNAETGEVAANAAASRAQAYGAADASAGAGAANRAHAALLTTNAGLAPGLANAEIGQRNAAAGLAGAQADTARYDISPAHEAAVMAYGQRMGYVPRNGQIYQPSATGAPSPYTRSVTSLPMDSAAPAPAPTAPQQPASGGFDDGGTALPEGWQRMPHYAMGTSNVMDVAPPAQPGQSAGISSHGNNIPGTPAGPSFTGANPAHGSDPRDIPGFSHGTASVSGVSQTQDGQGMQPNPSGAPVGAPGGSPALVGVTGASSWGGAGMPEAKNFKKGTDKVPGKGDGKTDTQKAMLAPGEAVLNKAAAEHLGRDTIDLLNAAGARAMGLDGGAEPGQAPGVDPSQGKIPGHKKGTSDVSKPSPGGPAPAAQAGPGHKAPPPAGKGKGEAAPKDAAKADQKGPSPVKGKPAAQKSSGITPEMINALAGMMRGGAAGGMPAPMGPPPAPQPMPQAQMQVRQ